MPVPCSLLVLIKAPCSRGDATDPYVAVTESRLSIVTIIIIRHLLASAHLNADMDAAQWLVGIRAYSECIVFYNCDTTNYLPLIISIMIVTAIAIAIRMPSCSINSVVLRANG